MKKIGLTGCIGSGKSTVSRIFAQLGVPVYDADSRARELMTGSAELIMQIKDLFGTEAYFADGSLNRSHISAQAFRDPALLKKLNAAVHPAVFEDFDQWCAEQNTPYVIKEAALMFESDSHKQVDEAIVVSSPEELRIARAMQRDGTSREAVLGRMKNQFSEAEKLARGQYEIKNDEQQLLIPQVLKLHTRFQQG
jgi:dephospho-CoA kinase